MAMMGPGRTKKKDRKKENIENQYLELTDEEIRDYRIKYLKLPPTTYARERVKQGIESGIPLEFFVDTGIVTEKNLYELDFESEFLKKFLDYIRFKNNDEVQEEYVEVDTEIYEEKNEDVAETAENTGEIEETEQVSSKIDEEDKTEDKSDSDDVVARAIEELGKEINIEKDKTKDVQDKEENYVEKHKEVVNKEAVFRQEDIDLLREELNHSHRVKIKSLEDKFKKEIELLEKDLATKTDHIRALENKINSLIENNNGTLNRLSELRKEVAGYMEEISALNSEIYNLKNIKAKYDSIKDDYIKYKEFYETHSQVIRDMEDRHNKEISEYIERVNKAEKAYEEIQKLFHEFYTEGTQEIAYYTSSTSKNTIYFRMFGEPKYFYTMCRYLRQIIKNKDLRLLTVVFKEVNRFESKLWEDWIDLKDIDSVKDTVNYDDKVITGRMDRVKSAKLDGLLENYDFVIVLDFILDEKLQIDSPKIEVINVLKNNKQKDYLDISGKIVSEDDHEVIDLSHDETMTRITNERVKLLFYSKRLNGWLEEVLSKDIKI